MSEHSSQLDISNMDNELEEEHKKSEKIKMKNDNLLSKKDKKLENIIENKPINNNDEESCDESESSVKEICQD